MAKEGNPWTIQTNNKKKVSSGQMTQKEEYFPYSISRAHYQEFQTPIPIVLTLQKSSKLKSGRPQAQGFHSRKSLRVCWGWWAASEAGTALWGWAEQLNTSCRSGTHRSFQACDLCIPASALSQLGGQQGWAASWADSLKKREKPTEAHGRASLFLKGDYAVGCWKDPPSTPRVP